MYRVEILNIFLALLYGTVRSISYIPVLGMYSTVNQYDVRYRTLPGTTKPVPHTTLTSTIAKKWNKTKPEFAV